jgi:hypothetical protein
MARRRRNKLRTAGGPAKPGGVELRPPRRDHMARVQVDDATWRGFKAAAGETPINELLGQLVSRYVQRHETHEAAAGRIGDGELLEALERATELQRDLRRLVDRLEHRLGHGGFGASPPSEGLTSRMRTF